MHLETSSNKNATSIRNRFHVIEIAQMRLLVTFQQAINHSIQQSTKYDFTMMSLDLNENINEFFVLFSIHDKRNHSQKSFNHSKHKKRK
jgi:hypothetical protein